MERIIGLDPIVHGDDTILILGSMPSVKSLEQSWYYANPTNRFWDVLSNVFDKPISSMQDRLDVLKDNHIALWDSCHSCLRQGSSDASIQDIRPNDIVGLLKDNPSIQKVICNGKKSEETMRRFFSGFTGTYLSIDIGGQCAVSVG